MSRLKGSAKFVHVQTATDRADTFVRMWQWQPTARIVNGRHLCQNVALGISLTQGYQRASGWDKMCWVRRSMHQLLEGKLQAL